MLAATKPSSLSHPPATAANKQNELEAGTNRTDALLEISPCKCGAQKTVPDLYVLTDPFYIIFSIQSVSYSLLSRHKSCLFFPNK